MKVVRYVSFNRDVRRLKKRGKSFEEFKHVIGLLMAGETLGSEYNDHVLRGELTGWRDCHVEPDWIIIYKISRGKLFLFRTGMHKGLFV